MTAEEVTVVHVAEEEVVASSSSTTEIVVEKEEEKEKEKEDLSNGANGRIVKVDTDGDDDGSYVFVNGNDDVNGDPVESDLEKNDNGIGGEDRGVEIENFESKGEVKSESDLGKDLERKDGSCIGIVDQDKESMESCHVEGPVDEQKSGHLVESAPLSALNAEGGVSETSRVDQNGVSESPDDVSDSNGDGLPNCIAKHTVDAVAILDSSAKQSDEVSWASVSDSNGGSLANDSVEVTVVDSRSKGNEDSEIAVADYDCNGDGLVNNIVEENVVDSGSKEKEESEMAIADVRDCNGDGLANDSVEDNVVGSLSKENEDSEITVADDGDCNGDILANDSAKDTVSEGAADTWNEQNEVFELPVSDDGVPTVSASDSNGNDLPNGRIKDTVPEAVVVDSRAEQNDGVLFTVPDSNGDGLPADAVVDSVPEASKPEKESFNRVEAEDEADSHGPVSNGNGDRPEQNGFSEISEIVHPDVSNELVQGGENLVAMTDLPVEGGLDLEHNSERDLSSDVDTHLEKETGRSSISDECGESLQDVLIQDGISEKVVINDSVDSSQTSQQSQFSEVVESTPSPVTNENENVSDTTDSNIVTEASADVVEHSSSIVTLENVTDESGVSDTTAEALPVDDEKVETKVIKSDESDENSRGRSDSHNVENSEVDIEIVSDSVDGGSKGCLASGLKSETNTSSDSIVSEETEVSKGLTVCDSIKPVTVGDTNEKLAVADLQNDSSLAASLSNDEKAPAAVENLSAVGNPNINDGFVNESGVSNCDTNGNEQNSTVINGEIQFGSVGKCQEPEGLDEVERKPFYFLIRVPRFDDENLKEQIRLAQIRVDEKTQSRDAIRIEMQSKRATCKEYGNNFDAAISQERAARDLHRSKRQEIESIQSVMNIEDIDAKIRNMEHTMQHETLPLKDEKQFIREIKQLKQTRDRLSYSMGRQDEVQQGSDKKNPIEERLKSLKKEADQLKVNLLKAEAATKAAKKIYHDETERLNKLQSEFKAADDIRQEAYGQLQSLKKQAYEKNKYFWQYRDDAKTANDLALKRDREALQDLCVNQVEKFMHLWNNNDEFRKEYVRRNARSTLRRLRTLDGRALGPDEEPPVIPQVVNDRKTKDQMVSSSAIEERTQEKVALAKAEKANDKPVAMAVEQKNQTSKSEKTWKSVPAATDSTTASSRDKIEEAVQEKPKRTKEEEEMARKAEELRKEEEAAKLREQRRLEEIAKAKEALERKRRVAEKAQARAAARAQKEAEQKEKEREKRAKKKERRKVAATAVGDASATDETVSAPPTYETPAETPKESETKEKSVAVTKRSQKPSQFTKQNKAKSIPPPIRNRGKRRMQPWMWVILIILGILALFLIGNYNFSFNLGLQRFNF